MKVMFYEIQDCEYEPIDGKPAIIAPEGTDAELLRKYRFIQLLDGRWCHYMNRDEIAHMMNNADDKALCIQEPEEWNRSEADKQADYEAETGIILTFAMVLIFVLGVGITSVSFVYGAFVMLASILLLFISAIRSNRSAAIALIIILVIIPAAFLYMVMAALDNCANELNRCCGQFEAIGRMGSQMMRF